MQMKRRVSMGSALLALFISLPTAADMRKPERKQAKQMLAGTLYLKLDAPCTKGRHPYGVFYSPLVEVSPQGANTSADSGASFGWYHASSTVWKARINDPMELDELDWELDDGYVDIELEGVGSADGHDTVIRFVGISSLADFQAAYEHAFSRRPLQEDHPEWPQEIRNAIAKRQLLDGMNKRQAYYVVGMPSRVEKQEEDDTRIEIWTLQQQGLEVGYFGVRATGVGAAPETLRFEDGKLVASSTLNRGGHQLDLDN